MVTVENPEFSSSLATDLQQARDELNNLEQNIRVLSSRPDNRFGRGRGRGGFARPPIFGPGANFQRAEPKFEEDPRIAGVKRKFTAVDDDHSDLAEEDARRRIRRGVVVRTSTDVENGERPSLASSVMAAPREVKSRDKAIEEMRTDEPSAVKQRNRRLFQNAVLGTLTRFSKEERQVYKAQEEKQKEAERKLEDAKRNELRKKEDDRRELIRQKKEKQHNIWKLQMKMNLVEMASDWETHMRRMQNFIQTQTKPPIFYMPSKHTMRTIELQKKSVKRIEEIIQHHKQRMEDEIDSIEKAGIRGGGGNFRGGGDQAAGKPEDQAIEGVIIRDKGASQNQSHNREDTGRLRSRRYKDDNEEEDSDSEESDNEKADDDSKALSANKKPDAEVGTLVEAASTEPEPEVEIPKEDEVDGEVIPTDDVIVTQTDDAIVETPNVESASEAEPTSTEDS